jgi:hypothetical protein
MKSILFYSNRKSSRSWRSSGFLVFSLLSLGLGFSCKKNLSPQPEPTYHGYI